MSFEKGGRTDKFGNRYEGRCVIEFMIRMFQGRIKSITVEPVGDDEPGVDILVEDSNEHHIFYQCKARNASDDEWSISVLRRYDIPNHCKMHIKNDNDSYIMVSPLTYTDFSDLCLAARNSPSPHTFVHSTLENSKALSNCFDNVFSRFGLPKDEANIEKVAWYLARTDFVQFPDNNEQEEIEKSRLNCLFTGSVDDIYDALLNFPINDHLGKSITEQMLRSHLLARGHLPKDLAHDINIPTRILELNDQFRDAFRPVGGKIVHSPQSDTVIQSIESGRNVILLGKAGAGKSGCLCCVQAYLDDNCIPYLALSLDKCVPDISAARYGSDLGLPASPVQCLESQISKNNYGVLILDQLDSLRWLSVHSSTAYYVCKALLREVQAFHKDKKKIFVILACRTFDYENDAELKALCEQDTTKEPLNSWNTVTLSAWSESMVADFVGQGIYRKLTPSARNLLLTPSNLSIWSRLDEQSKTRPITTQYELLRLWIAQLYKHAASKNVSSESIKGFLGRMLQILSSQGSFQFSCASFASYGDTVYRFLLSEGVLAETGKTFSFSHQSIADYLQVQEKLDLIYLGTPVEDTLPAYDEQLPQKRVFLQMIWQNLLDSGEDFFLPLAYHFLNSPTVRYYYKCTFWEALGQFTNPTEKTFLLIEKYWQNPQWQNFIQSTVFFGHIAYVKRYVEYGFSLDWDNDSAQSLLSSIASDDPLFVLDSVKKTALERAEIGQRVLRIFAYSENVLPEDVCALCLQILKKYPRTRSDSYFAYRIFKNHPPYAIKYLLLLLGDISVEHSNRYASISSGNEYFRPLAKEMPDLIIEWIVPALIEKTKSLKSYQLWDWSALESPDQQERFFAQLVADALDELLKRDEPSAKAFITCHMHTQSQLEHEWCLHLLCNMSDSSADIAYEWLITDFPLHFSEVTSNRKYSLELACEVLRRFSSLWSQKSFAELEKRIVNYQDSQQYELAKWRFESQRETKSPRYTPYWGRFQNDVLPALDSSRTMLKTKELIQVLSRRNICISGKPIIFHEKGGIGDVYTVHSPISDHLDKLSVRAWVKLLSQSNLPSENAVRHMWTDGVESSPREFAQSFQSAMEKQPEKFLPIARALPANIHTSYRQAILFLLDKNAILEELSPEQACTIAEKFAADISETSNQGESCGICWLLQNHADFVWPDLIYQKVKLLALKHPMPAPDEFSVTSSNDAEHKTVSSLRDNSLNCVRGSAYHAIASTLWEQPDMTSYFLDAVYQGCTDSNPAVRFAVTRCLAAITHSDSHTPCHKMHLMLMQDNRLLAIRPAAWFALRNYKSYSKDYDVILEKAINSTDNDLTKSAASVAVQIYAVHGGAKTVVYRNVYSESALSGIISALMYYLSENIHRERAYNLFIHILEHCHSIPTYSIAQYMHDGEIKYFDNKLWMLLVEKIDDFYFSDILIDYYLRLNEMAFYRNRSIVFHLCETCCASNSSNHFLQDGKLVLLILRLFDFSNCESCERRKYLSLFDDMFRNNILTVNTLLEKLNS